MALNEQVHKILIFHRCCHFHFRDLGNFLNCTIEDNSPFETESAISLAISEPMHKYIPSTEKKTLNDLGFKWVSNGFHFSSLVLLTLGDILAISNNIGLFCECSQGQYPPYPLRSHLFTSS